MHANWSLILNILLLTGVSIALVRMIRSRYHVIDALPPDKSERQETRLSEKMDDVIAVRKVQRPTVATVTPTLSAVPQPSARTSNEKVMPLRAASVEATSVKPMNESKLSAVCVDSSQEPALSLFLLLQAKENRMLSGYELLQTILSAGLRFGEGSLFHRHQYANGQGPVLCSLATATPGGVFDLQNIGAFSVHGLCLFMQASGSSGIDLERFQVMVETAKQLSEGLDTRILDDQRKPWSDVSEARYISRLTMKDLETAS